MYILQKKKLSFKNLSEAYVQYLEDENDDRLNQLIEAETVVLEDISSQRKIATDKTKRKHQLRALYLLNKSNRFMMNETNDRLQYNEDEAKQLSWYERNKEIKY